MPYDDPDPSDPSVLHGVSLPADEAATNEMAHVFAEEFARLGLPEERIRGLFRSPFYAAAHRCFRLLGEESIDRMIRESVAVWGPRRCTTAPTDEGDDVRRH